MYLGQAETPATTWIDGILFQSIGPYSAATYGDTVNQAINSGIDLRISNGLYFIPADQLDEWAAYIEPEVVAAPEPVIAPIPAPVYQTGTQVTFDGILFQAIGLFSAASYSDTVNQALNNNIELRVSGGYYFIPADQVERWTILISRPSVIEPESITAPIPALETVTIPVVETFTVPGPMPATVTLTDSALVAPSVVPIEPDIVASAPLTESPGLSIAAARITLLVVAGLLLR